MICNATYDKYEDIPEELRPEFESVDGKWNLKESAVPGAGLLFNSSVAANMAKAVNQVKQKNLKIDELTTEIESLKAQIEKDPTTTMSKKDIELYNKYKELGEYDDLANSINELPTLKENLRKTEVQAMVQSVAQAANLNHDVLNDWMSQRPDLKFEIQEIETLDEKKQAVKIKKPVVKLETEHNGKIKVEEHDLSEYAKANLPEWKYSALMAKAQDQKTQAPIGAKVPDFGRASVTKEKTQEATRPVDKFNAERAKAVNPFMPASST